MNPLRLAWLFARIGALAELQYRVNFFIQIFHAVLELGTGLVGLALVFTHTTTLRGWGPNELLAVMGVHILMGGFIRTTVQPNMIRLMNDVQQGTLDYVLTKPADAQALVSVREFRFWYGVDIVMGAIVLVVAVARLGGDVGVPAALGFAAALILGALMLYAFWLIITTGAFWVVRMENVIELFQGVYAAGRWPVGIYPGWLRQGLTFLVPVAFAVTVPAEALTGRLTGPSLLAAAGVAILFLAFARWWWKVGLRRYSGASA